jgi:Fic family protein
MALTYDKLICFDLLEDANKRIFDRENMGRLEQFLGVTHEIFVVDRFIRDCPSFPDSNKEIVRDELVSGIGSTLAIEGIVLEKKEIEAALEKSAMSREEAIRVQEQHAKNSRDVYDYIMNEVLRGSGEFVYSEETILTIHRLFTQNTDSFGNTPGAYRNTQAQFGYPRRISLCGTYAEIYQAMKRYVEWLNITGKGLLTSNAIAKAIIAHYYLGEMHPFGDGNGRTARAVEAMALLHRGINQYCFWSLANFWNRNRSEYIAQLGVIRDTCDPFDFILWGAKGYLEEVTRIKDRIRGKLKYLMLRDYVSYLLRTKKDQPSEKKINQRIHQVVFMLTDAGKIPLDKFRSSPFSEALYGSNKTAKSRDLSKMRALQLVRITSVEGIEYIEPNYDVLGQLSYRV